MKIFFDGKWFTYNTETGIIEEAGFFFMETAKGLYPYEVAQDLKNKKENLINA